jgi:hypothetical protein
VPAALAALVLIMLPHVIGAPSGSTPTRGPERLIRSVHGWEAKHDVFRSKPSTRDILCMNLFFAERTHV